MKKEHLFLLLLLISGCSKNLVVSKYGYAEQKIVDTLAKDEKMWREISTYKTELDIEMNVVLAQSDTVLTKAQPESDLGNFLCDLLLKKASDYSETKIDLTILNYGGIRVPNLPKGNITLGKITELMPFENRLVVMQLNGLVIDSLIQHIASKGSWPISGARYKIKNGKANQIQINGSNLNPNKLYTLAISDYLAQGGDNCALLKNYPYTDTKKTIREALIEGLKEMTVRQEHIKSVLDGRVVIDTTNR